MNGKMMKRNTIGLLLVVMYLGAFVACSSDPDPGPIIDPTDTGGTEDVEEDLDVEDVEDDDTTDPPDVEEQEDADVDAGETATRTCPESMDNSCLAPALSCVGDARVESQCIAYGDPESAGYREEVRFTNGAVVEFRVADLGQGPREFLTVYAPDGEQCYNLTAQEDGETPSMWRLAEPRFGEFYLQIGEEYVETECAFGDEERCSLQRVNQAFALPWERSEECAPFQPDDLCAFDSDCGEGQGCCQPPGTSIRQCQSLEYCISQRDPITCETSGDCSSGETCIRCPRPDEGPNPSRECIPDEIAQDQDNSLSCLADECITGDETCGGSDVCCELNGIYRCLIPGECGSPPDPNPLCDPNSSQVCPSGSQQCCYDEEVQDFRCLFNVGFCQTDVCYLDGDCASNEECCGADSPPGSAGICASSCEPADLSCEDDGDCSDGLGCCIYPGYDSGECGTSDQCELESCDGNDDCGSGFYCCDEAPLSEGICLLEESQACPPVF